MVRVRSVCNKQKCFQVRIFPNPAFFLRLAAAVLPNISSMSEEGETKKFNRSLVRWENHYGNFFQARNLQKWKFIKREKGKTRAKMFYDGNNRESGTSSIYGVEDNA